MASLATEDTISTTYPTQSNDAPRARPSAARGIPVDNAAESGARPPSKLKFEPLDAVVQDPYDNVACTD